MLLVVYIFLTVAFSSALGAPEISDHFVNEGSWPWIAAVYHLSEDSRTFKCTGALIHSSTVLTSASCAFEDGRLVITRRIRIEQGIFNLNEIGPNVQEFKVFEIIPHPHFNASNLENNIAIIRLSTEAILNDNLQPVRLWNSNRTESPETIKKLGTVVGWGLTQEYTEQITDTLQQTIMPVAASVNCLNSKTETVLPHRCYCAGYRDGTRFGNADHAATMIFEEDGVYRIRGIASKIVPKEDGHSTDLRQYVIFTDVATFVPWIQEVVPELNSHSAENDRPKPTTTSAEPLTTTAAPCTAPPLTVCRDFCGRYTGMSSNCPQFDLGMQWSSAGAISGKHCIQIIEPSDPHTWSDNFICFNQLHGIRWSSRGTIAGMHCTQIIEVSDPHTWHDNFLCVPIDSPFRFQWSSSAPIRGLCCVQTYEPADPHTWQDNYLCVRPA